MVWVEFGSLVFDCVFTVQVLVCSWLFDSFSFGFSGCLDLVSFGQFGLG